MRTALILHEDAFLDREALARWLGSFSDLAGIVVIREGRGRLLQRVQREIKRSGLMRFFDVVAFRVFYGLFLQAQDKTRLKALNESVCALFSPLSEGSVELLVASPNSPEAEQFLCGLKPDLVVARCKVLLKERIFNIPARGTFVMHPGICPEYRNAHGCFWALANDDLQNVGMTLLRVDKGVDTGPVFGFYRCVFEETAETHITIQARTVFDNLHDIQEKLLEIFADQALALDVHGRPSAVWGQPWLTKYLAWKWRAKLRNSGT